MKVNNFKVYLLMQQLHTLIFIILQTWLSEKVLTYRLWAREFCCENGMLLFLCFFVCMCVHVSVCVRACVFVCVCL